MTLQFPQHSVQSLLMGLLTGGILGTVALPSQAIDQFGSSIQFEQDTIVEFEFIESNGAYQSTFGVVNQSTGERTPLIEEVKPSDRPQNIFAPSTFRDDAGVSSSDFIGTPGNTVPQPLAEFEFKANIPYAFYLESFVNGRSAGIFYSTDLDELENVQLAQFEGNFADLGAGGVRIRWDDTGSALVPPPEQDRDFDDFLIEAGGSIACPYDELAQSSGQLFASAGCAVTE